MFCTFKLDVPRVRSPAPNLVRVLATLTLLALAGPATLSAQGDTTFTAWLRFRTPAGLDLREPEIFRSPWAGGPRLGAAHAGDAWLRSVDAVRDSLEDNRVTAMRLRHIYGRKAPGMEDSLAAGPRGAFGLNRKYADLNIDGQARTELRTEKLKNLRCTPAQLLDLNSGCRGGFKTPRFDTYLSVRAGGLIGRLSRIPGGTFLVPMTTGVVLQAMGLMTIVLPTWFLVGCFALLGWNIGLGFTPQILSHALRALPQTLIAIFTLIGFSIVLAVMLVHTLKVDPLTAYLATSPGGMDAIAIIAASTQVDVPLVMGMQIVRFLIVLMAGPPLARLLASRVGKPKKRRLDADTKKAIKQVQEDEGELD